MILRNIRVQVTNQNPQIVSIRQAQDRLDPSTWLRRTHPYPLLGGDKGWVGVLDETISIQQNGL